MGYNNLKELIFEDTSAIFKELEQKYIDRLYGKKILITGFAGSLGYMLCQFFNNHHDELGITKVYCLDNYIFGRPKFVDEISKNEIFEIVEGDVVDIDLSFAADAELIFHMASLASPVYYRLHPIETIDADVLGLRNLLDFYKNKDILGLLFYSTSEIYGDPVASMVPTPESYFGNCNTSGPRACYDESKRFGETLCYCYANEYNFPVRVVRPFNSYGPGLRSNDKRVVADFAKNILNSEDIEIFSNGLATRTFCYVTDTTIATIKAILHDSYDIFNIGMDKDEMTVASLAEIYKEIGILHFNYNGEITYKVHSDPHYLTDNPQRRCPDITKASRILNYYPAMSIKDGVKRYLDYLQFSEGR